MRDRRTYLRVDELRAEIAYEVGCDPTRYVGSDRRLDKEALQRLARALECSSGSEHIEQLPLRRLYPLVCESAGGRYNASAGNQWGINRDNLKAIHEAVEAGPMQVIDA